MYTLGFTEKYYTLWSVSVPQKVAIGVSPYIYQMAVTMTYMRNLSMDYEKAVEKIERISRGKWEEDLSLRGCTTWTKYVGPKFSDLENNQFTFGKLAGEKFEDVKDVWQLTRAMNEEIGGRRRVLARRRLIELGELVRVGRGQYKTYKEIQAEKLRKEKLLGHDHYYTEKEKVELLVKVFSSTYYDTDYGTVWIINFIEEGTGRKFVYKGSTPPAISDFKEEDEFGNPIRTSERARKIRAAIKHGEYNDLKQTYIQRIKIID